MERKEDIHPILKALIPVAKGLAKTLGRHYEVVLHDVSQTDASIIAIENGYITGRKVGSPVTDFLLEMMNTNGKDMELNYITRSKDGKKLKSSTLLIRDEDNNIIGSLCINLDLTSIDISKKFLDEISLIETEESPENFSDNVEDFLNLIIKKSLKKVDKPITLLTKQDKLKIVEYLHKNKVFSIKGAVDAVARELHVSRYTIYNYLDEISAAASNE